MYMCTNSTSTWETGQCIVYDVNEYDAQEREMLFINGMGCADGQYCPPTRNTNSTCTDSAPTRYANEPCSSKNACASGLTCNNGFCEGAGKGDACSSLYACNPGYYCSLDTLTCKALVAAGGACTTEYDCQIHNTCDGGKCVQYFSLANGSTTSLGTNPQGLSPTCATGYGRWLPTKNTFQCEEAPSSSGTPLASCHLGSQCGSTSNSGYYKPCSCGYTAEGSSFCPYFEGDSPLQHAIGNYTQLIAMNSKFTESCGTYSRFSEYCYMDANGPVKPYFDFVLSYLVYQDGVNLVNNPECVTKVFERMYYEEEQEEQDEDDNPYNPHHHDDTDDDSDDDSFAAFFALPLLLLGF